MGEKRMDGRMEVTEKQSDHMKTIKRQRTYGMLRSVGSVVFSVSFSTQHWCKTIHTNNKQP